MSVLIVCVVVVNAELDSLLQSPLILPPVAYKKRRLTAVTSTDSGWYKSVPLAACVSLQSTPAWHGYIGRRPVSRPVGR